MAIVNKFNVNNKQVTLDADIIENMSANDVSYNVSTKYNENTVGNKLSKLEKEVIYDVTANNDGITFTSLSALLSDESLSILIPVAVRCGGMSIRFVQSSDNKYVQYFLTKDEWSVSEADWEKTNLKEEVVQLGLFKGTLNNIRIPFPVTKGEYIHIQCTGTSSTMFQFRNSDDLLIHGFYVEDGDTDIVMECPFDSATINGGFGTLTNVKVEVIRTTIGQISEFVGIPTKKFVGQSINSVIPFVFIAGHKYIFWNNGAKCTFSTRKVQNDVNIETIGNPANDEVIEFTPTVNAYFLRIGYLDEPGEVAFTIYDGETNSLGYHSFLADKRNIGYVTQRYSNLDQLDIVPCELKAGHPYIFVGTGVAKCTILTRETENGINIDNIGDITRGDTVRFIPTKDAHFIRVGYYHNANRKFGFNIYDGQEGTIGYENYLAEVSDYNVKEELPLCADSPQLPANSDANSDFNAETTLSTDIQSAFETLISKMPIPNGTLPKFGNMYEVIGMDASNTYPLKTYIFGLKNRYAWKASDKWYAWESQESGSIFYTKKICPQIGDAVYNNQGSAVLTVTGYDSTNEQFTYVGNSNVLKRKASNNIEADIVYSTNIGGPQDTTLALVDRNGNTLGEGSWQDANTMTYNSKTYTRCLSFDWHTSQKGTIFIWGNEHGPQSDPLEASIVMYRFAKELCRGSRNKFIQYLRRYFKVVLLPVANPYGINKFVEDGREGRNNANNVNINRNYDTVGWSSQPDTDKGAYAGSESETQYIMNTCDAFNPDIAMDIHVVGYTVAANEGKCHHQGQLTSINDKVVDTMLLYNCLYSNYGFPRPTTQAQGSDWIYKMGFVGGLIEMNAGAYSPTYNGNQHTAEVMELDYTLFLNTLRMWYHGFDNTFNLDDYVIK